MGRNFTSIDFVVYHNAGGDRQLVEAAIAQGYLPRPTVNNTSTARQVLGWEDDVFNTLNVGEALEKVRGNVQADQLDLSAMGIDARALADAIAARLEGRQGIEASEFVTVDSVLAHYNRTLDDLVQVVGFGILPHPIVNSEGTAEGWPAAMFAFHENGLREAWSANEDEDTELPENPWEGFDQPDGDDESRDRHLKQLAALTNA
jgi:hypothetical protein